MRTSIEIDDDLMARALKLSRADFHPGRPANGRCLVVLLEILQGVATEREARRVETALRHFDRAPMLDPELAVQGAASCRCLRRRGITVRKTIDLIIATFCLAHGHTLLTSDRDFLPMAQHLGLQLLQEH
jgi:predicted nucleic acid-binding protein